VPCASDTPPASPAEAGWGQAGLGPGQGGEPFVGAAEPPAMGLAAGTGRPVRSQDRRGSGDEVGRSFGEVRTAVPRPSGRGR
jgi:hypothetical protein